ncbi:MAG TPA: hypothetical protein VFI31_17310 [Pirellulales bacterium]|nr:hypothetical protein [Pirellulales bacterium]
MTPQDKPATKAEKSPDRRRRKRPAVLMLVAVLVAVAVGSGGYALWKSVSKRVLAAPQFVVKAEAVTVTPPPAWVRSDVKVEVVREIELAGPVSILDDDLGERFYEAFAAHPWVSKVVRVLKRPPAGVEVELIYRRPVLMVLVPDGLLPVDGQAVQLPTADFSALEAQRYPRIDVGHATPPPAGTRWSDRRVVSAAALAAALIDDWQELGLHHLAFAHESSSAGAFEFELFTKKGSCVAWGVAPGDSEAERAATADKLSRLRQYAAEHGTLDGARGPQNLDVRSPHGVEVTPRAAARPVEHR